MRALKITIEGDPEARLILANVLRACLKERRHTVRLTDNGKLMETWSLPMFIENFDVSIEAGEPAPVSIAPGADLIEEMVSTAPEIKKSRRGK